MSEKMIKKNLSQPDETREIPKGKLEIVKLGELVAGRGTLQPGWRWSEHVKPIVGGTSCQVKHVGYVVSGRMRVKMDDGTEHEIAAGDAHVIPPGHDAWIVGDEPFVGLDFSGSAPQYAKP
jgi:quercetin dioxygenase-like cupin family protein